MSSIVKELLKNYYSIDDSSKLDLDMAINVLIKHDEFNEEERIILKFTIEQVHYKDISEAIGKKKSTVNGKFNKIAEKIANYLGEEYQDEKIIKKVEFRLGRKLEPDEEKFCWKVIRAGRSIKGVNIFNFREQDAKRGKDKTEG